MISIVEILLVNGSFGAYFVLFFFNFYYWLAFVFGENLCVAEELYMIGWSLWR